MSLIININSLSYLYDYLDLGVHDFIVGTNQFSCRQALTVDYIELKEIKEKLNINPYNISRCISGTLKSACGYIWKLE